MIATQSMVDDILERMSFSDPREVDTRAGRRIVKSAPIYSNTRKDFWESWNREKAEWQERGYSVGKHGEDWMLSQWLNTDKSVSEMSVEAARRSREEATSGQLPADWVPGDVELTSDQSKLLFSYQVPSAKRLKRALGIGNALDASETGCHARGTPILMFDGTLKAVEEVAVGDFLMGWDSTPRRVLSLASGREQMARIVPTKGAPFIVNMGHILTLVQTNTPHGMHNPTNGQYSDVTVKDWFAWGPTKKHINKLFRVGVDCWPEIEFPLHPYSLGVLLGDGCMTTKNNLSVSKPGNEILAEAQRIAHQFGCRLVIGLNEQNPTHGFRNNSLLWGELQSLGLAGKYSGTKFIPQTYKTSSRAQRLEVLAGLLDTDGHCENTGYDYISKSQRLSEDVAFVARSLGLAAYVKECRKGCQTGAVGTYYRVSIFGDCSVIPCRIPRKRAAKRIQKKDVLRTGFKVELLPEDDFYGFSIEGDGRFCLGDFTVTHNTGKTIVALIAAHELGLTPCIIAPLAVLPTWTRWAETLGVKIGWVINYDKIRGGKSGLGRWRPMEHGKGEEFVYDYLPGEKPLLVFDECQKIKGVDSKQGNLFRSAARAGHKILALSATAAKDPCDMRNLGAALGLHDGSMNSFIKFCLTHGCQNGRYGLKFNPRNKHMLEKIHREIFPLKGTRLRVCDIPDFPETQIHAETLICDTASIRAAYDEMEIELEKLEADSSKSNSEKSSQGFAAIMKARKAAEKGKLDLFAELATDAIEEGRSVVIFLNFLAHIDVLRKSLKTECVIWGTDMDGRAQKPETRQAHIDDFNADRARICIVSMQAGGAGLSLHDLTGKHPRLSLVSPSYSVIDLKQCLGRVHRAGAKTKSFQRIVFAHGTIEQEICVSLQEKLSNMDRLQDGDLVAPGLAKQLHDLSKHTGGMDL